MREHIVERHNALHSRQVRSSPLRVRRPHARCNQRRKKIGNAASPEEGYEETS